MWEWGKGIPLKENFCNHSYTIKTTKSIRELKKGNEEKNKSKDDRTELQTEKSSKKANKQTKKKQTNKQRSRKKIYIYLKKNNFTKKNLKVTRDALIS